MHRQVTYKTDKFSDCFDHENRRILAFTIRTTDGRDENYAAKRAEAAGTTVSEELIKFSLVSYVCATKSASGSDTSEEIKIEHPFGGFEQWSTKARNLVMAAWRKLATPDEAELADFFASATESA